MDIFHSWMLIPFFFFCHKYFQIFNWYRVLEARRADYSKLLTGTGKEEGDDGVDLESFNAYHDDEVDVDVDVGTATNRMTFWPLSSPHGLA